MLLTYVEEINSGPDVDWEKFYKERIDEAVAYAKRPWTDEEYEKWADNQLKDDEFRDWPNKKKALFKKLMIEGKKAERTLYEKINDFSILDKLVQINENWDVYDSILKDRVL